MKFAQNYDNHHQRQKVIRKKHKKKTKTIHILNATTPKIHQSHHITSN